MEILARPDVLHASIVLLPLPLRLVDRLIGSAGDCIDDVDHAHHSRAARVRGLLLGGGGGVAGRNAFDGGWLGSATKAQIPTTAARAWEGAAAAATPRVCMTAVGGTHVRVPKAGKIGGDMVVAGP
jgi:hypothetical protein